MMMMMMMKWCEKEENFENELDLTT